MTEHYRSVESCRGTWATKPANNIDDHCQCFKLSDVVLVGAGQYRVDGNALRFGDEVLLRAQSRAVCQIRPCFRLILRRRMAKNRR